MDDEFGLILPSQETEEFPIDQIALVRMLDGPPRTVDGHFILETAFQRTQSGRSVNSIATVGQPHYPIPRITLHFSLNGCVADTTSGDSWVGADYVVISPLQDTLRENPKAHLRNLLGGDTYFEVSPSEEFQLPSDTVLVKPGNPDYISGIKQPSNIKIYKSMNFTDDDYLEVI